MSDVDHGRPGNCVHCGRKLTPQAGYANVAGGAVCHPRIPDGPDCYHLITVYGEERGKRLPVFAPSQPTDAELEEVRRKLDTVQDQAASVILTSAEQHSQVEETLQQRIAQLTYERSLLGHARRVLDQVAESAWAQGDLATDAGSVAQRIVDEIGHPVTDEPALGPGYREQIAELEAKLEEMTRCRDSALRQLNREDDEAPFELEELISQGIDAVISDWEGDVPLERVIESIARALHPDVVKLEERAERAEARAKELADEGVNLLKEIATIKGHYQRRTETLEAARDRNKKLLDAVVNEVFTVADAHRPADKRSLDYLYSLGRLEGFSQVRFAVLRGLGCFDPNHEVWIPFSRVEDVDLIRLAINDPGAFTEREKVHDGEYESLGQWGARAVIIALREGRGDR